MQDGACNCISMDPPAMPLKRYNLTNVSWVFFSPSERPSFLSNIRTMFCIPPWHNILSSLFLYWIWFTLIEVNKSFFVISIVSYSMRSAWQTESRLAYLSKRVFTFLELWLVTKCHRCCDATSLHMWCNTIGSKMWWTNRMLGKNIYQSEDPTFL